MKHRCDGCAKMKTSVHVQSVGRNLCPTCRKMVACGQSLPTDPRPTVLILRGTVWMGHPK